MSKVIDLNLNLRFMSLSFDHNDGESIDPELWHVKEIRAQGSDLNSVINSVRVRGYTVRNNGPELFSGHSDPQYDYSHSDTFSLDEIAETDEGLSELLQRLVFRALAERYFEAVNKSPAGATEKVGA